MDRFHELRLELSYSTPDCFHLSLFVTEPDGQWSLLDDWTVEDQAGADMAMGEASSFVDGWLNTARLVASH